MKNLAVILSVMLCVAVIGCGPSAETKKMLSMVDSLGKNFDPSKDLGVNLTEWEGQAKGALGNLKAYSDSLQKGKYPDSVKTQAKNLVGKFEGMMTTYNSMVDGNKEKFKAEQEAAAKAVKSMNMDELKKVMSNINNERTVMKQDVDKLKATYDELVAGYKSLTSTVTAMAAPAAAKKK
jgi:hypothetical protein